MSNKVDFDIPFTNEKEAGKLNVDILHSAVSHFLQTTNEKAGKLKRGYLAFCTEPRWYLG